MEVGGVIRDLRAKAGMSQEELAEKVFVSFVRQHLSPPLQEKMRWVA